MVGSAADDPSATFAFPNSTPRSGRSTCPTVTGFRARCGESGQVRSTLESYLDDSDLMHPLSIDASLE